MVNVSDKYIPIIGLEIHVQLLTKSKAFAPDINQYAGLPNHNIGVISLGHPGTLPKINKEQINAALKLGLALKCDIALYMYFARKNYFYPDLPKGYQITQDKTPICTGGLITIKDDVGKDKVINITRIHMEEDAGKSIHDQDPFNTLIDLNRAGVPLLEIVSEPQIATPKEAYNYLTEIRKLVRYLEICDGNMEEGSLRCDANVSVMLKGAKEFGQRTEIKNMNSIRNVQRAIENEIVRQIEVIESGGSIFMETRSFDAAKGVTFSLRKKENAHDYRYFPEPDLQPVTISQEQLDSIKKNLPALPQELFYKYTDVFHLSEYDAGVLTSLKETAMFFEEIIKKTNNYKAACNWLTGEIKSYCNKNAISLVNFPILPKAIAEVIELIDAKKINYNVASKQLFLLMISDPEKSVLTVVEENDLLQKTDSNAIENTVTSVLQENPDEVKRYRNGQKQLFGFFMGKVMQKSGGKADPKEVNQVVRQMLENHEG